MATACFTSVNIDFSRIYSINDRGRFFVRPEAELKTISPQDVFP
jgi:hypothetical protein